MERHLAGLEAGIDPELIAERTRKAQLEIVAAEAIPNSVPDAAMPLTLDETVATLQALQNVPRLLDAADPTTRAELYPALGITLTLSTRRRRGLHSGPRPTRRRGRNRVGGGLSPDDTTVVHR